MAELTSALRIYIDYEYLTAQQLGELLLGLHELFDEVYYAAAPHLRELPGARAANLRIETVETSSSIAVYLLQGITQLVASRDPALVGMAVGPAALVVTGRLVLGLVSRAEDLRAQWRRDNRADERARLDLAEKRLDVAAKERDMAARSEAGRQLQLPDTKAVLADQAGLAAEQYDALAQRAQPHLDAIGRVVSAENIIRIEITLPRQGS